MKRQRAAPIPDLHAEPACYHAWEFESIGVDENSLRGEGPQRYNFRCTKCPLMQRMECLVEARLLPDLTKPVHSTWRR